MLTNLSAIFDKKSPVFLMNMVMLICASVLWLHYSHPETPLPLVIIVMGALQMLMKTLGVAIAQQCWTPDHAKLYHLVVVLIFLGINIAVWVQSIRQASQCSKNETLKSGPYCFFLQFYASLYSVIFAMGLGLLLLLHFEDNVMTVFERERVAFVEREDI